MEFETRLKKNSLRRKLAAQKVVLGTFMEIPAPSLVEIAGLAGLDFFIVDGEHGPFTAKSTEEMVRASASTDISPVVRVRENSSQAILQALDAGAAAVQVPHIGSKDEATDACRAARFHPRGSRGLNPYVRSASYSAQRGSAYLQGANDETVVVLQVEGAAGVQHLDAILTVEGLDVVFLGPYDLSQSLGVPGQIEHPSVREIMGRVIEAAKRAGKTVGTFADAPEQAARWIELGVQYIAVAADAGLFLGACRSLVEDLKGCS
jgi:4-hydroxy-2-oxoheptanedioate aldolase